MQIEVGTRSNAAGWSQHWDLLLAIGIAQVLSVALAATGVSSQALSNQGVNAPTFQAFLNYCLLAVVFGGGRLASLLMRRWRGTSTRDAPNTTTTTITTTSSRGAGRAVVRRLLVFAVLALLDVEANTLVTSAYQFTSLTSVTLLDCFTIPCVMLLSWLMLASTYQRGHYAGAACCVAGLAVLVWSDAAAAGGGVGRGLPASLTTGSSASPGRLLRQLLSAPTAAADGTTPAAGAAAAAAGSAPLLGDALVLLGAALYAVCNVGQERLLGDVEASELLAFLGLFGAVISGAQAWVLEASVLRQAQWARLSVAGPMAAFALSMFLFYSAVPRVLILGGATLLNLSLLTSDAWSALARLLWFGGFSGPAAAFFVLSLLLVAAGIAIYALSGSPKSSSAKGGAAAAAAAGGGAAAAAAGGGAVVYSRVPGDAGDEEAQQQQQQHHSSSFGEGRSSCD